MENNNKWRRERRERKKRRVGKKKCVINIYKNKWLREECSLPTKNEGYQFLAFFLPAYLVTVQSNLP